MRQFRRLQRIQLKTSAARTVPPDFMRRMIAAHRECPWTRHSEAAIVHHGSCGIRHGKACPGSLVDGRRPNYRSWRRRPRAKRNAPMSGLCVASRGNCHHIGQRPRQRGVSKRKEQMKRISPIPHRRAPKATKAAPNYRALFPSPANPPARKLLPVSGMTPRRKG
jgi:hypothetical protein